MDNLHMVKAILLETSNPSDSNIDCGRKDWELKLMFEHLGMLLTLATLSIFEEHATPRRECARTKPLSATLLFAPCGSKAVCINRDRAHHYPKSCKNCEH